VLDRVGLFCPHVSAGESDIEVMVHSKVMIVDDRLLVVGSANLNNRSIGLDTECNLAVEGDTPDQRRQIRRMRDRLLGHHCGVSAQELSAVLAQTGSLIRTALTASSRGHYLEPVEEGGLEVPPTSVLENIADPERPIPPPAFLQSLVGERPQGRPLRRLAGIIAIGIAIVALMLAWRFTPLSMIAHPDSVREWLSTIADAPAAPFIVLAVFVVGGLVVFPVLLLIAATAAAFGPWLGFAYATAGALASAVVTYVIGAGIGRDALEGVLGPRLNRVRRSIVARGVLAMAAVRLVPIAPFTLVNLVAGASRIRFGDYVLGTALGMIPGITMMSALGFQIWTIVMEPTAANVIIFLLAVIGWLAMSLGAQALILRWRRNGSL
jgi:uncharacterized membrane protein YdjX (TVP38/TMEM64 family)